RQEWQRAQQAWQVLPSWVVRQIWRAAVQPLRRLSTRRKPRCRAEATCPAWGEYRAAVLAAVALTQEMGAIPAAHRSLKRLALVIVPAALVAVSNRQQAFLWGQPEIWLRVPARWWLRNSKNVWLIQPVVVWHLRSVKARIPLVVTAWAVKATATLSGRCDYDAQHF